MKGHSLLQFGYVEWGKDFISTAANITRGDGAIVEDIVHYSASMTAERTLRHEMQVALALLQERSDWTAVRRDIIDRNLFQTRSLRTTTTYLQQIRRRFQILDEPLRRAYLAGNLSDQNALLLYAFISSYRLAREFVLEVVRHDWQELKPHISRSDFLTFVTRKAEQSDVVARWSPKTIRNLHQVLMTFLGECQLLRRVESGRWEITPIAISPVLKAYVDSTDRYRDFEKITLNA